MVSKLLSHRPTPALVVAVVALVMAASGFAVAAIPGSDGRISACVHKTTGAARIVDEKAKCKRTEKRVAWNQQGVPGAVGAAGAPGPQGTAGANGKDGTNGIDGKNGKDGKDGLPGASASQVFRSEVPGLTETNSTDPVSANGPSVTVTVPAGGAFAMIHAEATISQAGSGCSAEIKVYRGEVESVTGVGTGICGTGPQTVQFKSSNGFEWVEEGTHTYTMRYHASADGGQASFTNRKLRVALIK